MTLKVADLPRGDLNNIPELMRGAAQTIQDGELGEITSGCAVLINADGVPTVFGWGRTDDVHSTGLLHLGADWLSQHRVIR